MKKVRLVTFAATVGLLATASPASATTVCNEAENSPRGGYVVNGGTVDPNPPAFLRGSTMRVGQQEANPGLLLAAEVSPALRTCGPPPPPPHSGPFIPPPGGWFPADT